MCINHSKSMLWSIEDVSVVDDGGNIVVDDFEASGQGADVCFRRRDVR